MKTLQDIRREYPQYAGVPDDQLAQALHAKFYANAMPLEDFKARLGVQPAPSAEELRRAEFDAMNADMNVGEKLLVGAGRGFTDLAQGVKQLGLNAAGLVSDDAKAAAEAYNRKVADEARLFEEATQGNGSFAVGRVAGQIAGTLPLGGLGGGFVKGGATALNQLGRAGLVGAGQGAVQAAATVNDQATDGDFWGEKLQQAAIGGASGAIGGAVGQGAVRALQGGVNLPGRTLNAVADAVQPQSPQSYELAIKMAQEAGDTVRVEQLQAAAQQAMRDQGGIVGRLLRGSVAQQRKADKVAQATGINLSPGQRSGNPVAKQMENWAPPYGTCTGIPSRAHWNTRTNGWSAQRCSTTAPACSTRSAWPIRGRSTRA